MGPNNLGDVFVGTAFSQIKIEKGKFAFLCSRVFTLSLVLTSHASISTSISIRSLCASEDDRDISISIYACVECIFVSIFVFITEKSYSGVFPS